MDDVTRSRDVDTDVTDEFESVDVGELCVEQFVHNALDTPTGGLTVSVRARASGCCGVEVSVVGVQRFFVRRVADARRALYICNTLHTVLSCYYYCSIKLKLGEPRGINMENFRPLPLPLWPLDGQKVQKHHNVKMRSVRLTALSIDPILVIHKK